MENIPQWKKELFEQIVDPLSKMDILDRLAFAMLLLKDCDRLVCENIKDKEAKGFVLDFLNRELIPTLSRES